MYKTIGDVVREHAAQDTRSTDDGIKMLELKARGIDDGEANGAANLYLAALSIIREQDKKLAALGATENRVSREGK